MKHRLQHSERKKKSKRKKQSLVYFLYRVWLTFGNHDPYVQYRLEETLYSDHFNFSRDVDYIRNKDFIYI